MAAERVYRAVIGLFRVAFRGLGLRFDLRNVERIPATGAAVLASNHLSYLDFTFVELAARTAHGRFIRFMAKKSTFDSRLSGPLMRAMQHIPVDRLSGAAAYRKAARALRAGELVGVFPEATISRTFALKSFKLGAATLAVREQVPLVPVALWAPQRTFTVDKHYSFGRGKTIMILIGEPIVTAPDASPADVDAELQRRLQQLLDEAMRDYPDQPRGADDTWWVPAAHGGTAMTREQATAREKEREARWHK